MALDREIALADAPTWVGTVEHRIMLGLQVWCALDRHRAANVDVGGLDLALAEANMRQEVERRRRKRLDRNAEDGAAEVLAERPHVKHELDIESGWQGFFDLVDCLG